MKKATTIFNIQTSVRNASTTAAACCCCCKCTCCCCGS